MTTGEFEFDMLFLNTVDESDNEVPLPKLYFPGAAYFLWIVFIIMMPVLFNNLLVGLAVRDTASERARATLIRLGLQVRLALEVEDSTPVLRRLCKKMMKTYTFVASGKFSFVTRNGYNWQRKLLSGLKDDKELQAILNTFQRSTKDLPKELKETVVKQIDELEQGFIDKLQVLENLIQSTKKSISQLQMLPFEASPNNTKEYSFSARNKSIDVAKRLSVSDALKMSINERQTQNDALRLPHTDRMNDYRTFAK